MMNKYTKEFLEPIFAYSTTMAEVARKVGIKPFGGGMNHIKTKALFFGISIDNFVGQAWSRGRAFKKRRLSAIDILVRMPKGSNRKEAYQLRRALIEVGVPEECFVCGIDTEWNGNYLVLEVDHKDGDYLNNTAENLRFVCPNCHSQTKNYKSKNIRRAAGRTKKRS